MLTQYGAQLQSSSKLVEEALSLLEEPSHSQFLLISRDLINRSVICSRHGVLTGHFLSCEINELQLLSVANRLRIFDALSIKLVHLCEIRTHLLVGLGIVLYCVSGSG